MQAPCQRRSRSVRWRAAGRAPERQGLAGVAAVRCRNGSAPVVGDRQACFLQLPSHARANDIRYWLGLGVLLAGGLATAGPVAGTTVWQSPCGDPGSGGSRGPRGSAGRATTWPRTARIRACGWFSAAQPLTATVPANGVRSARVTAEVRCDGDQPWRLYLPVRIAEHPAGGGGEPGARPRHGFGARRRPLGEFNAPAPRRRGRCTILPRSLAGACAGRRTRARP